MLTAGNAVLLSNSQLRHSSSRPIFCSTELTAPKEALYRLRKIIAIADWEIMFGII